MSSSDKKGGKRRRVVVTGIGAVTPLGNTMDDTWNGMIEGVSVAGPVQRFDASGFPTTIAYEVRGFDEAARPSGVAEGDWPFLNAAGRFGVAAAAQALEQAGLQGLDPFRVAACIGNGMGSPDFAWYEKHYLPSQFDEQTYRNHAQFFPEMLTAVIAKLAGAKGGTTTVHTACASSGQALGEAYELIRYGEADMCITGGADSMVNPYYFAGFSLLGAMSRRNDDPATASRPFDRNRDGFVLGEGACMLVFEELEHALARGAKPLAEVCGYGVTESAYRITDLHPDGTGPIEAMQMALDDAAVDASKIGYINAHGTSTSLNDRIEAFAISKVFPSSRCRTLVSSTKSMTGHMISAAGAIEFATCVKALQHQVLPPSINILTKDLEVLAELTPPKPTACELHFALSNSVGFGGSNTALLAGRIDV